MDRQKLVGMAVLVVVIVVALVIVIRRTSSVATPTADMVAAAGEKVDMIDMKTLEVFSEPGSDWKGKYKPKPDAPTHYQNPKTGEYTVVAAMKCMSCGQLIPVPDIPADLLPPPPAESKLGGGQYGPSPERLKYNKEMLRVRVQVLAAYKCPKCGKNAVTTSGPPAQSQ